MRKKKKTKTKKSAKVKATSRHEVVVRVEAMQPVVKPQDLEPIQDGGKYMIPKTWMSEKQVIRLVQNTPPAHRYKRPARGGGTWEYVTGHYVEKVLNYIFGWNWDYEVVRENIYGTQTGRDEQAVTLVKLTVKSSKGDQIVKMQYGRKDVAYQKGSNKHLDIGNDFKSAATDGLKKCASLLGIASDIYGKTEVKEEIGQDIGNGVENTTTGQIQATPRALPALKAPETAKMEQKPKKEEYPICAGVKGQCYGTGFVTQAEKNYSTKLFGKPLCRNCQAQTKK